MENFRFTQESHHHLIQAPYVPIGGPNEREEFQQWLAKLQSDGRKRISDEFTNLTRTLNDHRNAAEAWKKHPDYNRYQDMPCFDCSRVVLHDGLEPDYIHANFITGFHRKQAYVLTQGPLSNTVVDFWRMVWQEGIATIVMATRLEERGKPKCIRYFPETND